MARTVLSVNKLDDRNKLSNAIATSALTTAVNEKDGAEFVMNERDDKYLILLQNSTTAAITVTIKHGNGLQGVCDLSESLAASSSAYVSLDSGRFKNVTGEDKGKVVIGGVSGLKVGVFVLP